MLLRPVWRQPETIGASSGFELTDGRFRLTFEKAPIGLAHVAPDGRWLEVNERLCAILGYSRACLLKRTFQELTYPDDLVGDLDRVRAMLAAEIEGYSIEKRYIRADGSLVWCNLTVSLIRSDDGVPGHFVSAVEDISARRAAEARVLEMQHTLEARVAERTADLAASEAKHRLLTECANEMIATMAPDGTILFVTPAVLRVLGYTPEEVLGRTTMSLTHPADIAPTMALFGRLVEAGPCAPAVSYEFRARHKDGRWIWLEGQPRVEFDNVGRPIAFQDIVRDVSARKDAEAALRLSRALLARTSAAAGVGGWELDVATGELLWSDQTCLIHDVAPDFCPTLEKALGFYEPEVRPVIGEAVEHAIATGNGFDIELPMVGARGRRFWARALGVTEVEDGRVVRLVGALQDVTERRQIQRELSERQEQLRVTLESIGEAVIAADSAGIVTWLNLEAERLTGCDANGAVGRSLNEVVCCFEHGSELPLAIPHPRDRPCPLPRNMTLVGAGRKLDIDGTVSPVLEPTRGCLGHVIVFRDVSEERCRERNLEYRATHDALTGLLNRQAFEDLLRDAADEGRRRRSLLLIDLDGFKQVNDCCGHPAGDRVLRQVADVLLKEAGLIGAARVARLGGDEFAILLECDIPEIALSLADCLCAGVSQFQFELGESSFGLGASVGISISADGYFDDASLLEAADEACYRAKRAGKGRAMLAYARRAM